MHAPGQYTWRLAPRLGAAVGAWKGSAQSARASGPEEPVILDEPAPRGERAPLPRRTPRPPRAARGTGWRCRQAPSCQSAPFQTLPSPCPETRLRLRLSGWRICALCETVSGPRRRRWRPRRPSTKVPLCVVVPGLASEEAAAEFRWMLGRLLVGAEAECGRCCFGGGRLEQRLHVVDAAWAVAGCGRGITKA
jgi:hypothetical protein